MEEDTKPTAKYPAICSLLPQVHYHLDPNLPSPSGDLGTFAMDSVIYGKWTVDNLINYKRKYQHDKPHDQKVIYMVNEDEKIAVENLRSFDYDNTPIPSASDDRYALLDRCLELHKKFTDSGIQNRYLTHLVNAAVGSAYSLCKKLNEVLNKHGIADLRPLADYDSKFKTYRKVYGSRK